MIFLGDFSFVKIFLKKLLCYHDNYFRYFMSRKCNGFVSKARVSACMYFLVYILYLHFVDECLKVQIQREIFFVVTPHVERC